MPQPLSPDDPLHCWQTLARAANALFARGQMEVSIGLYRQALEAAERQLLSADLLPDAGIAMYTVSRLNLAEVHGRSELITILKMTLDSTQAWRDAALCHHLRTHLELEHFLRTHEHAGIARLLQASHPPATHLN